MATSQLTDFSPSPHDRWDLPDLLLVPGDSLEAYFARLATIPILTAQEEAVLGQAIRAGHRDAALELAYYNLRYAAYLARRWERDLVHEPVWSLSDGVQAANIGLWRAVQTFDPTAGRLTTYATWWIRQVWDRARNDFLWQIRLPAHAAQEYHAYQRAISTWQKAHATDPSADELAQWLGWPLARVQFWQTWTAQAQNPTSLNGLLTEHEIERGDLVPDAHADVWQSLDHLFQKQAVTDLLAILKPREADILRLRFGIGTGAPMTLQEIGDVLQVTRERIRQIETRALTTLREVVDAHPEWGLRDLLTSA